MTDTTIDYGSRVAIKAGKFVGEVEGEIDGTVDAANVTGLDAAAVDAVAAKTEVAALAAIDSAAELTEAVTAINAIIAALKA